MRLPSDTDLALELQALSVHLYGGINREGDLGPTREEYDKWRDRKWSTSRSLLGVFGLSVNRAGWTKLVQSYGFLCPSMGEVRQADHRRRQATRGGGYRYIQDEFNVLTGTVTYEETYYEDLGDGAYNKVTRTYTSLR
jgi:hypothetical protein